MLTVRSFISRYAYGTISHITVCLWYDQSDHGMLTVRPRSDQGMLTVRSQSNQGMLTVRSESDHGMLTVRSIRSRYAQGTIAVRSRYAHGQVTVKEDILGLYLDASVHTNDHRHVTVRSRESTAET